MSLFIHKLSSEPDTAWDKIVNNSDNGTLFHERKFLSYHKDKKFKDHSLILKKNDTAVAVIPFTEEIGQAKTSLFSHKGTSFAGLVYKDINMQKALDYTDSLCDYFQQQKIAHVCLNLPPSFYENHPNDYFEYALLKRGFVYAKQELTSAIDISNLQGEFILDFNNKARTNIRKAQKSDLTLSFSRDFNTFSQLLETTFWEKHKVKPTHSRQDIETLMSLYPDRIKIMAVYKNSKMIGGTLLFLCNQRVALTFYLVVDPNYQDLRPLNFLIYELVKWVKDNKFAYVDFGTITQNDHINLGLTKFKENFSAFGIFRNSLTLDL